MHAACCIRLLHVASFRPHGTRSGSHVAYSGCMLHGRVARCTARALRIVIAICTSRRTLRITAASRDARCVLHVASSMLRVTRRRCVRVAAAAPTDGGALAHARQLFQIGLLPSPHGLPLRAACPYTGLPLRAACHLSTGLTFGKRFCYYAGLLLIKGHKFPSSNPSAICICIL